MKTELTDVTPTEKQLAVELPAEAVEAEIARVARNYTRSARIPGFRPGKAPATLVRQRYKDQILHDVMHAMVPRAIDEALRDKAIEPLETPSVRDVSLSEGEPLRFTATFETAPPIEALDYATFTVRRSPIAVSDEAVARTLERLRERAARFEPVEDRPAAMGDFVAADLTRTVVKSGTGAAPDVEGGKTERHPDVTIEIGSKSNPPGFDESLVGSEPGTEKTFTVTFPPDYAIEEMRGIEVEYTASVKGIRRKVLPALDDEFAKDLGEFESLEALRSRVADDLKRDAEVGQEREIRNDLLRQVAARAPFEAPKGLVERELDRRTEEFVRRLVDNGVDPRKAGIDWERFREEQLDAARETVKSMLVLDDAARREGITVTEADVAAELDRLASRTGRTVAEVRGRLEKDGTIGQFYGGLRREKTVAFLLSRATILTV